MDEQLAARSAGLMGFDAWDRVEPLDGGHGGASRAWKDARAHVVKTYRSEDASRGARERAALHALDGRAGTPTLLAESDDPPMVVMTHLEGSGSLADALLGADPDRAEDALIRWARAVAALHGAGSGAVRSAYAEALLARAPELAPRSLAGDFEVAATRYATALEELGLPSHAEALGELRDLPARLAGAGHEVLSPADTCPDNNVVGPDAVHLIDFEHAELRHRAWDVAYLLAPWPSCWCAWRIPDDLARAGVDAYVEAAGERAGPQFEADLGLATTGWQAMTPAWFLAGALAGDDATAGPERPSRRAFVLHRLAAVAHADLAPALADMAADLHRALLDRWGDVPLLLAPAFRGTGRRFV